MQEQEKAMISKQFIESLTQVPVITCPARIADIGTGIKQFFPDFLKNSFPFFMTGNLVESLEPLILYHVTDFIGLNFNLFLYGEGEDGRANVFIAGPYLTRQADTEFCERVLQENGGIYLC